MPSKKLTPVRKQYLEIKKKYPEEIVFFRLGDFYETFDEDAETTSRELDIVLTSRNVSKGQRVPMAGIPFHAAENYIARLIKKGYHVAICEQVGEQPQSGLFPRKVVRVITPGTVVESGLISSEKNNYLATLYGFEGKFGFSYADLSTGEFAVTEIAGENVREQILSEISRLKPTEIIIPDHFDIFWNDSYFVSQYPDWKFEVGRCEQIINQQFGSTTSDGLGLKNKDEAIITAGVILQYIQEKEPSSLPLLRDIHFYSLKDYMVLDDSTRRNLELTETIRGNTEKGSLVNVIDKTITPMGKRLIRKWVNQPLIDRYEINKRLDLAEKFNQGGLERIEIQNILKKIADIERIINRIISFHAMPRELVSLRNSLSEIPDLVEKVGKISGQSKPEEMYFPPCLEELALLRNAISDDPPATLQNIGIIREGFSEELDNLLLRTNDSREWIANLESSEKKRTGIKTLKVDYNKIYGYYIEISKSYVDQVPDEYIRKQTLVNAERYITPELKEYESQVLNAEERIRDLENRLFNQVCSTLAKSAKNILHLSNSISSLDVLLSFGQIASENNYCKPEIHNGIETRIKDGRHPVVEKTQSGISFVPNDVLFNEGQIVHIITGPNMSGKSTYLRQTALIVLLAQIGSFVPASSARIGLVDRIFTRIGAQDEIQAGQSTFMVEMVETSNILHAATGKSLLILDEIGRGTSTYDGLSIAWAVLEYIYNHPELKSRTLFATHYHELTALPGIYPKMKNLNVAVSEEGKDVVFLHKIVEGQSDRSYGIHVAQMAGVPRTVIQRASELLSQFEENSRHPDIEKIHLSAQIPLFEPEHPVISKLREIDPNNLSPIDALNILFEWKSQFDKK